MTGMQGHDNEALKADVDMPGFSKGGAWLLALTEGMPQVSWRSAARGTWTWSSPQWAWYTGPATDESNGGGWLSA